MTDALRYDRAELVSAVRTDEGYLLVQGTIARPGIYVYRNADGSTRRELVPRDVLHDEASLATARRKPVTLGHPPRAALPLGPDTVGTYGVGDTDAETTLDAAGRIRIGMAVRRRDAIEAVESGVVELSPGYRIRVDNTPGVDPEFGPYDARQTGRVYDHVAIVPKARGGADLRLDADDAEIAEPAARVTLSTLGDPTMRPILSILLAAGMTAELAETTSVEIEALPTVRTDADDEKIAAVEGERDAFRDERDELRTRLDAIDENEIGQRYAAEREKLSGLALRLDCKVEPSHTNAEIRASVFKAAGIETEGKPDGYLDGYLEALATRTDEAEAGPDGADGLRIDSKPKPVSKPNPDAELVKAAADSERAFVSNLNATT